MKDVAGNVLQSYFLHMCRVKRTWAQRPGFIFRRTDTATGFMGGIRAVVMVESTVWLMMLSVHAGQRTNNANDIAKCTLNQHR